MLFGEIQKQLVHVVTARSNRSVLGGSQRNRMLNTLLTRLNLLLKINFNRDKLRCFAGLNSYLKQLPLPGGHYYHCKSPAAQAFPTKTPTCLKLKGSSDNLHGMMGKLN